MSNLTANTLKWTVPYTIFCVLTTLYIVLDKDNIYSRVFFYIFERFNAFLEELEHNLSFLYGVIILHGYPRIFSS